MSKRVIVLLCVLLVAVSVVFAAGRTEGEDKKMGQSLFLWDWIKLSKYRESRTSEDLKMIA